MSEMQILIGHVEKLCNKVDKIDEKVDQIQIVQVIQGKDIADNKDSLIQHMKRTELIEKRVNVLEEPGIVKKHIWKIIAGAFFLVSGVLGILKFLT